MMLTYHISHEKFFSTALYVHGRSGVNMHTWTTLQAIYACMPSDLRLVYMVPRNSIQLLNINTIKFQVESEPVHRFRVYHCTTS